MREMRLIRCCLVTTALAMTILSVPSPAQEQQRNIRSVLFVKVKADRVGDWKAAVKDYAALMKKAGVEQGFTAWSAQSGPDEYAIVWYSANWKELDQSGDPKIKPVAGDLARIIARLQGASASLETWVDEIQPDLVVRSKELPKMVRTGRIRVAYGKTDDVLAIFRSDTLPAMKKASTSSVLPYGRRACDLQKRHSAGDEEGGSQRLRRGDCPLRYAQQRDPHLLVL